VKAGTCADLVRLTRHISTSMPNIKLGFLQYGSTVLPELRNQMAKHAVDEGADWTLWIDADMRFPADALNRLMKHRRDIVGCNYSTRVCPGRYTAKRLTDDGQHAIDVPTFAHSTGLEEVDGLGFGCILINARVFKALDDPWFSTPWAPDAGKHMSEDIFFCVKAGANGHQTFLDHDLSKEIKHVGGFEYALPHIWSLDDVPEETKAKALDATSSRDAA
jgi:hypothetical protein